jgi:hypothetical protein
MFSLIQFPNLRWIPMALSMSPILARDTIEENKNVRYFIPIRQSTVLLIKCNRKKLNQHPSPLKIFEMLSQSCYLGVTSPSIERPTIAIFMIYAFRSASSKGTPSMEKLQLRSTFLAVLLSPLQDMHILKVNQLKCSSPFTLRLSDG